MKTFVREGHLSFIRDDERGCIQSPKEYGMRFEGVFLEKVNTEDTCVSPYKVREDFYPVLKRMLQKSMNWTSELSFHGLATFMPSLMEWTEEIMQTNQQTLKKIGIFGLRCLPFSLHVSQ